MLIEVFWHCQSSLLPRGLAFWAMKCLQWALAFMSWPLHSICFVYLVGQMGLASMNGHFVIGQTYTANSLFSFQGYNHVMFLAFLRCSNWRLSFGSSKWPKNDWAIFKPSLPGLAWSDFLILGLPKVYTFLVFFLGGGTLPLTDVELVRQVGLQQKINYGFLGKSMSWSLGAFIDSFLNRLFLSRIGSSSSLSLGRWSEDLLFMFDGGRKPGGTFRCLDLWSLGTFMLKVKRPPGMFLIAWLPKRSKE